jgi:HEPN domain-containing protein
MGRAGVGCISSPKYHSWKFIIVCGILTRMNAREIKNTIEYWVNTAKHDYDTMEYLFKGKKYSDSLFFGHIVLEKILKALVVKKIKEQAPYTHNLVKLEELAKLSFDKKLIEFLNQVNDFNIRARYPEQKQAFYKKCTFQYAKKYNKEIKSLYKDLCQKLK